MSAFRSVLVTPNFDGADGISCLSRQIAAALPEPVMVLSLHDAGATTDLRKSAAGSRVRFLWDAFAVAMRCNGDTIVVCSHSHLAPIAAAMSWRGAHVTNVLCGIEAWTRLRRPETWALARGRLISISAHTADRFRLANPAFRSAPIEVCHPGLPPRDDMTTESGEADAALIVGRMSAREAYKGHDELLRVWPRVLERHPGAMLWVVGDGDDRPRLQQLADSLGIAASVTFTGRLPDAELDRCYRACRFFAMPSRNEGFGLVFLEAMRAGKPCIGAPGAAEEIIRHAVTGLVVDPGNADDLTAALGQLFEDRGMCEAMGRAGAARFRAEFTDARFAARLVPPRPANVRCEPALKRPVG
jgi:glycosyltransferase involved in cell wall biosynthesis